CRCRKQSDGSTRSPARSGLRARWTSCSRRCRSRCSSRDELQAPRDGRQPFSRGHYAERRQLLLQALHALGVVEIGEEQGGLVDPARAQRAQDEDALHFGGAARGGRAGFVDQQRGIGAAKIEIEQHAAAPGRALQRLGETLRTNEFELRAEEALEALGVLAAVLADEESHAGGAG